MQDIYSKISSAGGRLTKVKKTIVESLSQKHCLLTKQELVTSLQKQGLRPDRSTIYRELKSLTELNVVVKNTILGVDYYEIPDKHHHHLVCLDCKKIEDIEIDEHLEEQESAISQKKGFNVTHHSHEFYGYCNDCTNK